MLTHRLNTIFLGVSVILFFVFRVTFTLSWVVLAGVFIIWLTLLVAGSFNIQLNYHLKALNQNYAVSEKAIALTFDDGPTPFTSEVLDLLKRHNQKATFFCIGMQAEKFPHILKRITDEGHSVGNHTYSHSNKTGFLNVNEVVLEIEKGDEILGRDLKIKMFRPPFGVTNPSIKKALQQTRHHVIGWSIRSLDTVITNEVRIFEKILRQLRPGSVVLLHDTSQKTVNVLRRLLLKMDEQSYKSQTVENLFKINAYEI